MTSINQAFATQRFAKKYKVTAICFCLLASHATAAMADNCLGSCINGAGTLLLSNGDSYEGAFKDGKMNGQGVETFANGDRYEGEFADNLPNGQGIGLYANGDRYQGLAMQTATNPARVSKSLPTAINFRANLATICLMAKV